MSEARPSGLPHWPVRLSQVPSGGLDFVRDRLSEDDARAFAAHLGVQALSAFHLKAHIRPHRGDGLAVEGRVRATVAQTCVVSLEAMDNLIDEEIEVSYRPQEVLKPVLVEDEDGIAIDAGIDSDDPLIGGTIDLAAIAAEFLALGIDPYPRKPGIDFDAPSAGEGASPFAALAKLKR
ncbi:DUF177 domain-containing protein [Phreatobacter aquaticus]|uniref:DUF177 domain-containing protein n=1 Tax=Phreatobacter aquaticus TaxID=2570229 RepID=A0A4D7QPI4_9HYPH|nr:DUF177 domain-containing protein [Phreatobacter aquaticus]QCK87174.1 DUF177 domain-containing protein [Phreatobacter aquaticus]